MSIERNPATNPAQPCCAAAFIALAIAAAPLIGLVAYKAVVAPRPFWAWLYDPEAIYFSSGNELLHGMVPSNTDNPGTPVQVLSAAILLLTGNHPARFDAFRLCGYGVGMLAMIGAMSLMQRTLLWELPASLQVAAMWIFFLAPTALERLTIWSPELFYLPVGAVLIAALWHCASTPSTWRAFAVGMALGLGCAVKLTFLAFVPAVVLALLLLESSRRFGGLQRCAASLAGMCVGFVTMTLPVVAAYPRMLSWAGRFAAAGYEGVETGAAPWELLFTNLPPAILHAKPWYLLILLGTGAVVAGLMSSGSMATRPTRRQVGCLGVFAVVSIVFVHLLAYRTESYRYLLPGGIGGVVLFALAVRTSAFSRRAVQWTATAAIAALLGKQMLLDLEVHQAVCQGATVARERIDAAIQARAKENPVVVYSWRAPVPSFALRIMDGRRLMTEQVETMYPNDGHYNPWNRHVALPRLAHDWDAIVLSREDWMSFPDRREARIVEEISHGQYALLVIARSADKQ